MKKIFWDNPYQSTLQTKILYLQGQEFVPEETIAYSFSGGQESDKAWVDGVEILGSRMEGPLIFYHLPENHSFLVNQKVTMTIDWPRRYRLMRLHFAAELILELITRKYCLLKIGAHISELKARIDFQSEQNISVIFEELLKAYSTIIYSDAPIEKGFTDVQNQRRFWKIDGFAEVPCGGTHVRSTAEVGMIKLKRSHPGKGVERIEITLEDTVSCS